MAKIRLDPKRSQRMVNDGLERVHETFILGPRPTKKEIEAARKKREKEERNATE